MHKRQPKITKLKITKLSLLFCVMIGVLLTPFTAFALPSPAPLTTAPSPSSTRLGGFDCYETAAKIARQGWPQTADHVILASGLKTALADALSAGPLAAKLKAPIILTDGGQALNSFAKAELLRLKPEKVYLTSGTAVIKPAVLAEITDMGMTPISLGGYDRYETSVNIAKELIALQGGKVSKVVVAAGWTAPADALSVSSIAASLGIPILATTRDALPPCTKNFLSEHSEITDSYVIGGTAVVDNAIADSLPGIVHRYSGITKYDTNLEVLKGFADKVQYDKVYVANGETFVDALSGAALAALTHSPIILGQSGSGWAPEMKNFLQSNNFRSVIALGGVAAVPDEVVEKLTADTPLDPPVIPPLTPPVQPPTVPTVPTVPGSVTISNLEVITEPANNLGTFSNGALIDLSALDNSVKVLGFALIADQNCILQFKFLSDTQNIPLIAGQRKIVTVGDLITAGQIQSAVTVGEFRLFYTTKTLQGRLLINGVSVGTLTVNLKF